MIHHNFTETMTAGNHPRVPRWLQRGRPVNAGVHGPRRWLLLFELSKFTRNGALAQGTGL
jgi:hypothetical protein